MGELSSFFSIYDEHLKRETDPSKQVNYRMSRPKFEVLLATLAQEPFDSLLEVGISEFCAVLKQVFPEKRIVGLGLHVPALNWGTPEGLHLVQGDVLTFSDAAAIGQFDVVFFSEVLEHVQGNPRAAFASLLPLVRPGGRLIVSTPNMARLFNRVKLLIGRTPLERVGPPGWAGHFREYTRDEIVDFLQWSGYVIERAEYGRYWDGVGFYRAGGTRGFDEHGNFYCRPRFSGLRGVLAWPLLKIVELLVDAVPSFRTGMVFVARRPV